MKACTAALVFALSITSAGLSLSAPITPASGNVLLAYEKTVFKTALIDEMTALLKKDSIAVTVVEHSADAPLKEDPAKYTAVFITNSGVGGNVRPWVTEWLNKHLAAAAKTILHTTQRGPWPVKVKADAVTSASLKDDKEIKEMAAEYTAKLRRLLVPAKADKTKN